MKVSVIMPFYNSSKYLTQAVNSVLNQTYINLELILVDDGSNDESASIVKAFSDKRIQYYFQENRGAASARNKGLKYADGDFITFLDSDDVLHSDKIKKQVDVLLRLPENAIASCSWCKFFELPDDSNIHVEQVWKDYSNPQQWSVESWLGGGMMQTACWLIPREVAEKAGPWNESLSLHDDGEYFTRVLLQAKSVKFVSDALVYYRQVPGSLCRVRNHEAIDSAYQVTDLSVRHLIEKKITPLAKKASARHYGRFAYEFYKENKDLANLALEKSKKLYPSRKLNVGPGKFNALVKLLGLKNTLQLKNILRKRK